MVQQGKMIDDYLFPSFPLASKELQRQCDFTSRVPTERHARCPIRPANVFSCLRKKQCRACISIPWLDRVHVDTLNEYIPASALSCHVETSSLLRFDGHGNVEHLHRLRMPSLLPNLRTALNTDTITRTDLRQQCRSFDHSMIPRVHNTSYRTSLRICPSAPSPESANQTPPPPVLRDISHNHLRHFKSAIGHGSSNEIDSTATSFPNRKAATLNIRHGFPHTTHTMCWELCTNGLPPPVHINWSILKGLCRVGGWLASLQW